MTKFGKAVLITGIIAVSVVGGYYGYQYAKSKGYLNKIYRSDTVSQEEKLSVSKFLNDEKNIGFLTVNYKELDMSKLTYDQIFKIISNKYFFDDENELKRYDLVSTDTYKYFKGTNEVTKGVITKVCYNTSLVNDYLYSVTNYKINTSEKKLCTTSISSYSYIAKINVKNVSKNDNSYKIKYEAMDGENYIYLQAHNYLDKDIAKVYSGTVVISYTKGRYLFVSNSIANGIDLE